MANRPLDPAIVERVLRAVAATCAERPEWVWACRGGKTPSQRASAMAALRQSSPDARDDTPAIWRDRFSTVAAHHGERWAAARRGVYMPPADPIPRSIEDDLAERAAVASAAAERLKLKRAQDEIDRLRRELGGYRAVEGAKIQPARWTLKAPAKGKSEHMPYLLTSDFQIGEVIRREEIDHAHGYDVDTFRRRYRRLIETTVHLCLHHQNQWTYPGIIYARGGDTISGGIHDELIETDETTPVDSVIVAVEEESAGIRKLAEAFGKVFVPQVPGNHDRDTKKPSSKRAFSHSYEKLVQHGLRLEFRGDDRVTFQSSESPDVFFPIYSTNILLTHGDRIGSRGGQGFIGPAATIARGAQKVIQEQMALGRRVDEVHMGHFHTPLDLDYAVCNGCLPGYSEFAKMFRMRPSPPSQWLMYYHPKHGRVSTKKIRLD